MVLLTDGKMNKSNWTICVVRSDHGLVTVFVNICVSLQVRDSDETDPAREKSVQLLDDFKISGVNGTRILASTISSVAHKPFVIFFFFSLSLFFCSLLRV